MLFRLKKCYLILERFPGERIFLWGILSFLVAVAISWFFIALFGADTTLFSFFFGLIVSLPDIAETTLKNRSRSSIR
jgi:hypothetical protein